MLLNDAMEKGRLRAQEREAAAVRSLGGREEGTLCTHTGMGHTHSHVQLVHSNKRNSSEQRPPAGKGVSCDDESL